MNKTKKFNHLSCSLNLIRCDFLFSKNNNKEVQYDDISIT